MTTERRAKTPYSGKGICRWCGKAVPKGRFSWCSDECVEAYLLRSDPARMRAFVLKRDKGICASCGFDCVMAEQFAERLKALQRRSERGNVIFCFFAAAMRECGFSIRNSRWEPVRTLWEADHIKPVVEGGGGCGPENIRTLCQPCHKSATAALAARRAQARKTAGPQTILPLETA